MKRKEHHRNKNLFDGWSVIHFTVGIVLGWTMSPFVALVIMTLWEPLEIFVLSPLLARYGITFGHETIQNSLSDLFFNTVGITFGAFVLADTFTPPLTLLMGR